VLDLSIETRPFGFDAASLVGAYASAIENRLLKAQAREQLVLQFQAHPDLLDSVQQGLAGIDEQGRLAWVNPAGRRLLGLAPGAPHEDLDTTLGLDLADLLALSHHDQPQARRLGNGLTVWLRVRLQAADGLRHLQAIGAPLRPPEPATEPVPDPTSGATANNNPQATEARPALYEHSRQHIEAALAQAGGNITRAARALGVSRGLLYRRLKSRIPPTSPV
jgi:transcriptional regulator of acetoin/glycerol metabolism